MAKHRMDVGEFVGKLLAETDQDLLREGIRVLAQALMDAEVSSQIGAELYERSESRTAHRNGYRTRTWDTRVGTVELRVPKVAPGTYFPSLLEPRRRAERALAAVIQEAYVKGISTRKVDDLVRALGMDGISKSEVSRICKELDKEVEVFRTRPIEGEHPYLWVDATYHKVREAGRVISMATVVAVGVNLLATVPKSTAGAVAAIVRTVFAQPDHASAMAQLHRVADGLRPRFSAAAALLEEAAEDVLAHFHFPEEHRRRLHSTNPLERLHKEVKRRTGVVGIFPDRTSLIRLAGMLLAEQDDEWAVTDRRYFTFESMARINEPEGGEPKELLAAIA